MTTIFKLKNHSHISIAKRLRALSRNMWWTWNPEAQALFNELSPLIWRYSSHKRCRSYARYIRMGIRSSAAGPWVFSTCAQCAGRIRFVYGEPSTWARHHASTLKNPVAYFSAEFGIHESLRFIPVVSAFFPAIIRNLQATLAYLSLVIGLFYRQGYFQQRIIPMVGRKNYIL